MALESRLQCLEAAGQRREGVDTRKAMSVWTVLEGNKGGATPSQSRRLRGY